MNLIEHLFMQAAGELCEKTERGTPEETKLANEEALAVLQKIDPAKLQGLLVMGIQSCEPGPNGEPGFELVSSMVGSPDLIRHLAAGVPVFIKMYQMNDLRQQLEKAGFGDAVNTPLTEAILGKTAVQGGKVAGRYDVPVDATKQ